MAIGDDATEAGLPLVPSTGEDGLVRDGAKEINKTRDFIARVMISLNDRIKGVWPVSSGGTGGTTRVAARNNLGIKSGTGNPSGGEDGDIYFKIIG